MDHLWSHLRKSRDFLVKGLSGLFQNEGFDAGSLEKVEEILLGGDLGWEITEEILEELKKSTDKVNDHWKFILLDLLMDKLPVSKGKIDDNRNESPRVTLFIGVNGSGKTTSIAKLAARMKKSGKKILLACADTFRAAASEQLCLWGQKLDIDVLTQHSGADPGAVAYDAVCRGLGRRYNEVLIDTAGRLPGRYDLLNELSKIGRVCNKAMDGAPHSTLLVLDGSVGQNAQPQAEKFNSALPVTGLIVTKLDGSAKGGAVLAMAHLLKIPIEYIGVGEGIENIIEFNRMDFLKSLLGIEDSRL